MVSTFISLLDIQSWWEIPCIAHFCSLFSSAFNLPDIDIEDLESALLTDGTEDPVGLLPELIVCLLKGCDALKNRNEITTSNYQMFLRRFLREQCRRYDTKNYFDTDIDFQSLPLRNKLLILYSLCHFRLESSNVQTILANLEADSLRVEPLGYDSKNSGYWYFYGTRLYREDKKPGGKNTVWQVICFTEEDWSNLAAKFKNSTSPKERALYKILTENFIPKLPQLFRERERLRRRKLLQVRNSARIHNILEETQRTLEQKKEAEQIQRQKHEEELKLQAANKSRTRTRRRSQSSSTASGISTYASSIRASTPSSEFFTHHETFCLSPEVGDVDGESISPKLNSIAYNKDKGKEITYKEQLPLLRRECERFVKVDEERSEEEVQRPIHVYKSEDCDVDVQSEETSNNSIVSKQRKPRNKVRVSISKEKKHNRSSSCDRETVSILAERREAMAPTSNVKLPGRQTNNSLSSIPENIFLSSVLSNSKESKNNKSKANKSTSANSKSKEKDRKEEKREVAEVTAESDSVSQKKKKNKGSETYTEKDEILQIGMHKVLLYVKNHRDAWPFMDPVDEEIAPRYYSIIRRPMDLLKMEEKLDNEEYKKYSEFRNDFKLIVNNCRLYNGQNNEYTEMVNNLQEAFDKATKKYLDQHSSDEDESFEYPDPRSTVFREKPFNKSIACKVAQSEGGKQAEQKTKESVQSTSHNESDEPDEEDEEKCSENRSGKKKRKDKDKRRKKKSKAKTHSKALEVDDIEHMTEYSENESDATSTALNKNKRRPTDKLKAKAVEPPPKRAKAKLSLSEGESCQVDISDKRNKKSPKPSSKQATRAKESDCYDAGNKDARFESDTEVILESEHVEKTTNKSRKTSKRKHSPDTEDISSGKRIPASLSKDILTATKSDKEEKTSPNSKSKLTKPASTSVTKRGLKKENVKPSKLQQAKDNKINSPTTTKKRKGRKKKAEDAKSPQDENIDGEKRTNSAESDANEESLSRSSSPPLFKVDLHEKYAKSASIKDEESSCDIIKGNRKSPIMDLPAKVNAEEELMSITSQSLSRSASPFNSFESDATESEKSKLMNPGRAHEKVTDLPAGEFEKSISSTTNQSPPSTTSSYFYLDKYDLIKQRRNRNTEEKWNQIVKEAEKMKDTKKATLGKSSSSESSKEKNQKLKETIEKLKLKNAKSKERSVLIDEIFGVKPTQQPRDEKTIFEKLRDSCPDSKSLPTERRIISPTSSATPVEPAKQPVQDAYEFVDDLVPPKPVVNKKTSQPTDKPVSTSKKILPKKEQVAKSGAKKPTVIGNKTNLEALELETEQTLKDINRWLEHTPRFPEFSSASNSPSRYNLLDDFDAVASKIDPNDFRRPGSLTAAKLEPVGIDEIADSNKQEIIEDLIPPLPGAVGSGAAVAGTPISGGPVANSSSAAIKPRDSSGSAQFLAHPPPPPHVKNQQQKDTKRKTLKEKLTGGSRRKDLLRTIDRLQPGKAKGNLISAINSSAKTEEILPVVAVNKIKEVKNSLVVKTDESGPKLSMGSVLQTEGFGLGQLHSFTDDNSEKKSKEEAPFVKSVVDKPAEEKEEAKKEEVGIPKCVEIEKPSQKMEKFTATPNLSAWFKAFGTPKKAKKAEEEEKKAAEAAAAAAADMSQNVTDGPNTDQATNNSCLNNMKSPPTSIADSFSLPAPRQRKASTGSTVSERSSFSQDPDSPRVGIEDRFGAYAGPYPSPIGASPIMVSPKPDEIGKPTSPYPLNGAIKVGFYQDTTTKSSPEKSCSPRELPSPYPQYSQHIYSTASSPTVNTEATNTYASYNSNSDATKSQVYTTAPASTLFEQYKQPRSQESDYNSMSPNTNSNSPYQQPQNSPYQQTQHSPYQQQSSPYQQAQNSPFQNQSNTSNVIGSSPNSPSMPQTSQQLQSESPRSQANSPYHQQTNSPYQQPTSSPYHQNSTPPYQATPTQQGQQPNIGFMAHQQSTAAQNNQVPAESAQRQATTNSLPYQPEPPTYSMHESSASNQYQTANRNSMAEFESNIPKRNSNAPNILDKMQQNADWNSQMDLTIPHSHQPERNPPGMATLNAISHAPTQLNTPPLQNDQLNQMQNDKSASMQYSHYPQFGGNSQKDTSKTNNMFVGDMTMDMSVGLQRQQQDKGIPQNQQQQQEHLKASQHDSNIINLGGYPDTSNRQEKHLQVQEQMPEKGQYDSLHKQQQMFDSFLGSMAGNKNLGIKSMDTPTSKAFEMFNRASALGFSKEFSNPLAAGHQKVIGTTIPNVSQSQMQQSFHIQTAGGKNMNTSSANNVAQVSNKPLNMASNNYQPMQQHHGESVASKMSTFPTPMSDPANEINKLHQQTSAQQLTATNYSSSEKMTNESMMANTRHEAMSQVSRNQQLNMELAGYKTYNNPASMLDPLRNLNHPLSMIDDSLLGLSGSSAPSGYYDKNIPPAAHMFSKNLSQQMYSNASPYGAPPRDQQIAPNTYGSSTSSSINPPQAMENFEAKATKRKKKKATAAAPVPTEIATNPVAMLPNQQVLQAQNLQSSQGFQLYSDLKTASSGSAGSDASAISLKTASSMVPGSAFNFGPTPGGLGLPAGMYGDNTGYLDPYYLPSSHRTAGEAANEKSSSAASVPAPAAPYQFLAHNPVRPTYPFMNSQLDPNSPIYQQYIQRQEQELRARMMINQGLLGSPAGTAGSYGQPGYRPATLGMPKHYDMSRQTWF